jgi:predicted phage baseplate assembly protein
MLPSLNLDDLTYQQIVDILRAHLAGEAWSDHNPSDPGIALMELLSWLGEMDLYRMNRVPGSHREKFLKLLVDPPVPVTSLVTIGLNPSRAIPVTLPPGMRVASDYRDGRRTVLESFRPVTLPPGALQTGSVSMRAVRDLGEVVLGTSNGAPNQSFALPGGPVLLDFASVTTGYDPNPALRVDGDPDTWTLQPFLLTAASKGAPTPKHFMIDPFEGRVRFGDDVFGAIPAAGAAIVLTRAQILDGPEALVAATTVRHVLNPERAPLLPGETLTVLDNTDAQGGENFFSIDERMRRGLEEFRKPTRLITADDFERVARDDFNEYQARFNAATGASPPTRDLVRRVTALMNRRAKNLNSPAPSYVTLMVLPEFDQAAFDALPTTAPSPSPSKTALVTPSAALQDRLKDFLEPRRLLTTRIEVIGPRLKEIAAQIVVVQEAQGGALQVAKAVDRALRGYLDISSGYDDGRGWPLGRPVRRSQIYRLLESLPGVDYVETLALSPANADGDIDLSPDELPVWGLGTSLDIQVRRV